MSELRKPTPVAIDAGTKDKLRQLILLAAVCSERDLAKTLDTNPTKFADCIQGVGCSRVALNFEATDIDHTRGQLKALMGVSPAPVATSAALDDFYSDPEAHRGLVNMLLDLVARAT